MINCMFFSISSLSRLLHSNFLHFFVLIFNTDSLSHSETTIKHDPRSYIARYLSHAWRKLSLSSVERKAVQSRSATFSYIYTSSITSLSISRSSTHYRHNYLTRLSRETYIFLPARAIKNARQSSLSLSLSSRAVYIRTTRRAAVKSLTFETSWRARTGSRFTNLAPRANERERERSYERRRRDKERIRERWSRRQQRTTYK